MGMFGVLWTRYCITEISSATYKCRHHFKVFQMKVSGNGLEMVVCLESELKNRGRGKFSEKVRRWF